VSTIGRAAVTVVLEALTPDDVRLCARLVEREDGKRWSPCGALALYVARYDDGEEIGALCAPCSTHFEFAVGGGARH